MLILSNRKHSRLALFSLVSSDSKGCSTDVEKILEGLDFFILIYQEPKRNSNNKMKDYFLNAVLVLYVW